MVKFNCHIFAFCDNLPTKPKNPSFSLTRQNHRERDREGKKKMERIANNVESIKSMKIRDTLTQYITLCSFSFSSLQKD